MINNTKDITTTEVVDTNIQEPVARDVTEPKTSGETGKSIRESLKNNLKISSDNIKEKVAKSASVEKTIQPEVVPVSTSEALPVIEPKQMIAPPADMSKAEQEMFAKASPEMQQYLSRRAYETRNYLAQKAMEISSKEKEFGDLYSVVTQDVRTEYAKQGIAVPDLINRAIAWDRSFKTNPIDTAREYLKAYGVNVADLIEHNDPYGQQSQTQNYLTRDDAERMAAEIAEKEFSKKLEILNQSALAAQNQNAVQSFISSKPLFKDPGTASQLEAQMAPIVAGLRAHNPSAPVEKILETAYDYVSKGHPVFSTLTSQLAAKQELDKQAVEAQRARQASKSISGGPGSGSPKQKFNNLRENLRARLNA